ncbi:MAG TPA: hypothetical protein VFB76_09420 [Candidatus Angelobacter sp.]|nr:hypothetical protein [Candidatus Angelobacter sp.]
MRKLLPSLVLCISLEVIAAFSQTQSTSPSSLLGNSSGNAIADGTATAETHLDGKSWWNYVKVLAADDMEGRETGSPGLRKAQEYVVEQLKHAGLEPAGSKGYYQPVQFISRQIVESDSSLALVNNGHTEPLTLGEDAIFSTRVNLAPTVDAPLVFAGYGLTVPENNYNDLEGLDLRSKVAVIFSGAPAEIPGALASHYQSAGERWKAMSKAGAVGIITIPNPAFMDIPWSRISANRTHPSMALKDPEFDETTGEELALVFNPTQASKLFEGSGHTLQEILDLLKTANRCRASLWL